MKGFFKMGLVIGIENLQTALNVGSAIDAMKEIGRMKLAGYDVRTDKNGTWMIPKSEIKRYQKGEKPRTKPAKAGR